MLRFARLVPAFVLGLSLFPLSAFAQTAAPGIDQRQQNQEKRIDQGVSSQQLNKRETKRLEKGQAKVNRMENRTKSDGKVTKKERAKVQTAQTAQSKRIYRQKHDAQTAKPKAN